MNTSHPSLPQVKGGIKIKFIKKLNHISNIIKKEISLYTLVMKDPRTPLIPKLLLFLALGYLLMPFDLIPDFIPVIGQIDDIIIVPLLFYLAIKFIPKDIIDKYRDMEYGLN